MLVNGSPDCHLKFSKQGTKYFTSAGLYFSRQIMKSAMIFINCLFIIKSNFLGRRFLRGRQLNA